MFPLSLVTVIYRIMSVVCHIAYYSTNKYTYVYMCIYKYIITQYVSYLAMFPMKTQKSKLFPNELVLN